jgi:hypothetical protein
MKYSVDLPVNLATALLQAIILWSGSRMNDGCPMAWKISSHSFDTAFGFALALLRLCRLSPLFRNLAIGLPQLYLLFNNSQTISEAIRLYFFPT